MSRTVYLLAERDYEQFDVIGLYGNVEAAKAAVPVMVNWETNGSDREWLGIRKHHRGGTHFVVEPVELHE